MTTESLLLETHFFSKARMYNTQAKMGGNFYSVIKLFLKLFCEYGLEKHNLHVANTSID